MSTTRRELTRRLALLLTLGVTTTVVLFLSVRSVHDDTVPLAEATAPGILAVDTAEQALLAAHKAARAGGRTGDTSGEFHTQISVAHQSLALAASKNVTGVAGRHDLQTITGLIAVYSGWVERWRQEDNEALSRAYARYADRALGSATAPSGTSPGSPPTDGPAGLEPSVRAGAPAGSDDSIAGRLEALRAEQVEEAERQRAFPWPLWAGWSAVAVLGPALCLALLETAWIVRRRFRHAVPVRLLAAAAVCAAGVPAAGWCTYRAQRAMNGSVAELRVPASASDGIPEVAGRVKEAMADAGFWASLSEWVLWGGAVVMALAVWGLWPWIVEYRWRAAR